MVPPSSNRISRVPPYLIRQIMLRVRGCHPYCPTFQMVPLTLTARLVPVRSPLLGEYLLISFPAGTEMFQFPAFALLTLCIQIKSTCFNQRSAMFPGTPPFNVPNGPKAARTVSRASLLAQRQINNSQSKIVRWVAPFGDSGIKGCSRLPRTYRRVPRPSSPLTA